jgi:hypothetical protein
VDALEHRVPLAPAPVRPRYVQQPEAVGGDLAGPPEVWPEAEVLEGVLGVGRDLAAAGSGLAVLVPTLLQLGYRLELVRLAREEPAGLLDADDPAAEGVVLPDYAPHAPLDLREVLGGQRAGQLEVVVEAVLEPVMRGAPPELRVGEHLRDGLRHHVGRGVAQTVGRVLSVHGGHGGRSLPISLRPPSYTYRPAKDTARLPRTPSARSSEITPSTHSGE